MATYPLLRLVFCILSSPLILISRVMTNLNLCGIAADLQRSIEAVDRAPTIPTSFVTTLIAAEDHRSSVHPGVDPIAMVRALMVWVRTGRIQGASTIEQQLVRVVLGRYEKTVQRKFKEQLIAIALSHERSKAQIAETYLSIAFYGPGLYGISALRLTCGLDLNAAVQYHISQMVARLKYPEPLYPSLTWRRKIQRRVEYIARRLPRSANNRFEVDVSRSACVDQAARYAALMEAGLPMI